MRVGRDWKHCTLPHLEALMCFQSAIKPFSDNNRLDHRCRRIEGTMRSSITRFTVPSSSPYEQLLMRECERQIATVASLPRDDGRRSDLISHHPLVTDKYHPNFRLRRIEGTTRLSATMPMVPSIPPYEQLLMREYERQIAAVASLPRDDGRRSDCNELRRLNPIFRNRYRLFQLLGYASSGGVLAHVG